VLLDPLLPKLLAAWDLGFDRRIHGLLFARGMAMQLVADLRGIDKSRVLSNFEKSCSTSRWSFSMSSMTSGSGLSL